MIEAVRLGARSPVGVLFEDLDLVAGDGEFWLVTGPPSCGKTVLAAILRGERCPDAGDFFADGKPVYRDPGETLRFRAQTGSVAEAPAAGESTVGGLFELAALAGGLVSRKERRDREEEVLALVGIPGAAGREARTLSTSERARVALAVELFRGPRYLFADRLLENAGPEWSDRIVALFRALAKEGKTIMAFERAMSGRWVPEAGEQVAHGPFRMSRFLAGTGAPR